MRAILPMALLAVTACYTPRAVEHTPDPWQGSDAWGMAPLEASLFYDDYTGYAYFDLTRPAHVAMFALRPGVGMEILYPRIGYGPANERFDIGRNVVWTAGSHYRLTGNWSLAHGQGPMYILLVASDEPLDVRQFRATRTLGWLNRSAVTWSPYTALDALVGEIVPRPNTSAWTTAMHVVWPRNAWPDRTQRYVRVRCASGMVVIAPMQAVLAGYPICPEDLRDQPADSAKGPKNLKGEKGLNEFAPRPAEPPQGWMKSRVADIDLDEELERLRRLNGKRDPGELTIRPFPARPPVERTRRWTFDRNGNDDRPGRRVDPPDVTRSRPASPAPVQPATPSRPANPPAKSKPSKSGKPGSGGS